MQMMHSRRLSTRKNDLDKTIVIGQIITFMFPINEVFIAGNSNPQVGVSIVWVDGLVERGSQLLKGGLGDERTFWGSISEEGEVEEEEDGDVIATGR